MAKRVPPVPPKRLVWRISEAAPLGEYVNPDKPVRPRSDPNTALPEASAGGGWIVSSFELLNGTDVSDGGKTVSDEDFDQLFAPPPAPPKPDPEST